MPGWCRSLDRRTLFLPGYKRTRRQWSPPYENVRWGYSICYRISGRQDSGRRKGWIWRTCSFHGWRKRIWRCSFTEEHFYWLRRRSDRPDLGRQTTAFWQTGILPWGEIFRRKLSTQTGACPQNHERQWCNSTYYRISGRYRMAFKCPWWWYWFLPITALLLYRKNG